MQDATEGATVSPEGGETEPEPAEERSLAGTERDLRTTLDRNQSIDATFAEALSTAEEYEEYAKVINAMPLAAAQAACRQEGISPSDDLMLTDLLGLRAALLLHFCGPPPTDMGMRAARSERAAKMRGTGRRRKKQVPLWQWAEFRRLVGQPILTDQDYMERIEGMAWQEWNMACKRLGIPTEGLAGSVVRQNLLAHFVKGANLRGSIFEGTDAAFETEDMASSTYGTNVRATGSHVRLRGEDYKDIIGLMTEQQAINAARIEEVVPLEWTESSVKSALRSKLCQDISPTKPKKTHLENAASLFGVVAVTKLVKTTVGVTKAQGFTPLQKWKAFKAQREIGEELERAAMLFKEIDVDGSGELNRSEICQLAEKLGGGLKPSELDEAMLEMDADGGGTVDMDEFLAWWQSARDSGSKWDVMINRRERQLQERERLKETFDRIDADDGGTLDIEELDILMEDMGLSLNTIELSAAMDEMDEDHSGEVDFEEFYDWFVHAPKTGTGLAAELQRGLRRSEMLQIARDAIFASFEGGQDKHLRHMFDRLDEDGSRDIDAEELTHLADGLRLNMPKAEIELACREIGDPDTGSIYYQQFADWWNGFSDRTGPSGRLRSKLKLSGFLAKRHGSVLVATELMDDDEGLAATEKYMVDLLHSSFSQTHVVQGNSLGFFPPEHPIRVFADKLFSDPFTDQMLVLAILVNMATLAFPPQSEGGTYGYGFINFCIGCGFVGEVSLRIIQQGFVKGVWHDDGSYTNTSYMTSWWNIFDFVVIIIWLFIVISSAIFDWDDRVSNSISVLRSLRCLRFFQHVRQMLTAIRKSTFIIVDIGYIFLVLFIMFGVALHTLLGGTLTHVCALPPVNSSYLPTISVPWDDCQNVGNKSDLDLTCTAGFKVEDCTSCSQKVDKCPAYMYCTNPGEECYEVSAQNMSLRSVQDDRAAHIDKYGFDNAATSFMTLFSMTTLDDWHWYVNSYREKLEPEGHQWWFVWVPVASFVVILGLCFVNIFLAGIAYSYISVRLQMKRFAAEEAAKDTIAMMLLADPADDDFGFEEEIDYGDPMCSACGGAQLTYKCRDIMQSDWFNSSILVVVVINIGFMCLETHGQTDEMTTFLLDADLIFTLVYFFEAGVKIQGMGFSLYLNSNMNKLDFFICLQAAISMILEIFDIIFNGGALFILRLLRIFRLFRVARVAKLVLKSDAVRFLLAKAFSSRQAIASLCFLILFVIIVASLASMQIFGQCFAEQTHPSFQDAGGHTQADVRMRPNFATFGDAFAATFVVFTTDSWTVMLFKFMECHSIAAVFFFMTLIFILYFLLCELFVAVFIENFDREDEDKRAQQIQQYLEATQEGNHAALDIKMKLDNVNDFLKMRETKKYTFDVFLAGVSLTKTTGRVVSENIPGGKKVNGFAKFLYNCITCNDKRRAPKSRGVTPGMQRLSNPLHDEDAEAGFTSTEVEVEEIPDGAFRDSSLGLFPRGSVFRSNCQSLKNSTALRYAIITLIVANAALCAKMHWNDKYYFVEGVDATSGSQGIEGSLPELEHVAQNRPAHDTLLRGIIFVGFFLEFVVCVVADGFLFTPAPYLSTLGNWVNFCLMLMQFGCLVWEETVLVVLVTMRLMFLVERMRVIGLTLTQATPVVTPVVGLIGATFLVFAIVGQNLFMGRLWYCEEDITLKRDDCVKMEGYNWVNQNYNYDTFFSACESLFVIWSLQGWVPMMEYTMNAPEEVHEAPVVNETFLFSLIFHFTFIVWNVYMLTNLFVSILADFFSSKSGNLLMTDGQRDWQYVNLVLFRLDPIRPLPASEWRLSIFRLSQNHSWRRFVDFFILLNVLQLVSVSSVLSLPSDIWTLIFAGQSVAILVFIAEFIIEIIAHGFIDYYKHSFVDFIVLCGMLVATGAGWIDRATDDGMDGTIPGWRYLQVLQLVRILRLATLIGRISGVRKLYYVIRVSFPEVVNLCMALVMILFVMGVFATRLCGGIPHDPAKGIFTQYDNFDDIINSMRLLFQIMTGQSFMFITQECEAWSLHVFWVKPFFFTFFCVGHFIFVSLFIALLLDNLALMGSDDFAISDVDVELFRQTWLSEGLEPYEELDAALLRQFVVRMPGSFSFIHKSDPFWFNRLLLELDLVPEDCAVEGQQTISMNRLLRALCQMRFSSRCLALDDEVQKSLKIQGHLQNHAAECIGVGVKAWRALRNIPAEEMEYDGGQRYRTAVWVAKILQMNAVISTQRITPENVVTQSLNELQRLMDRKMDRYLAREMHSDNTADRTARQRDALKSGGGVISRSDAKKRAKEKESHLWSVDTATIQDANVNAETFEETLAWKNRNAFLTRKTWHNNTGSEGRNKFETTGARWGADLKYADEFSEDADQKGSYNEIAARRQNQDPRQTRREEQLRRAEAAKNKSLSTKSLRVLGKKNSKDDGKSKDSMMQSGSSDAMQRSRDSGIIEVTPRSPARS